MSLMEFDQVLDPWKLTAKNNTHDVRIIRQGDNQWWLLTEFVGLILQVAVQPQ